VRWEKKVAGFMKDVLTLTIACFLVSSCLQQTGPTSNLTAGTPTLAGPANLTPYIYNTDKDKTGEVGYYKHPDSGGHDGGIVYGGTASLQCNFESVSLSTGQSTTLSWNYTAPPSSTSRLSFTLRSTRSDNVALGTLATQDDPYSVIYSSPNTVLEEFDVHVIAEDLNNPNLTPVYCVVRLARGGDLGVLDDGITRGLVGNVYPVPTWAPKLPNFDLLTPLQTIVIPNLDIPQRSFDSGFPGVQNLIEWFGVRFIAPTDRTYLFSLISDDGANLYIDGIKIVDNDGVHAPRQRNGSVHLTPGLHDIYVDYYQGPRFLIALQLLWQKADGEALEVISPDYIRRPSSN
jgi:hypothetical protein